MQNSKTKKWFRISELERKSGVSRRTIHFYLQEGLLHPPRKTGKTMAYYDENHLEELKKIRIAKKQGMPLFAIREQLAVEKGGSDFPKKAVAVKRLPKSAQGNRTREAILGIACKIFRKDGYKNTRVSDITRRLGVGKGTFYFYFSDKKELFLESVPRIFAELFSEGWDKIGREKNPLTRLSLRVIAVLPVLQEFCAILALSKEALFDPDPKLKKLGENIFASICRPLEQDIKKGVEMGLFRGVDPKLASATMIGIAEGLLYLQACEKDFSPFDARDRLFDLFFHGIQGESE